ARRLWHAALELEAACPFSTARPQTQGDPTIMVSRPFLVLRGLLLALTLGLVASGCGTGMATVSGTVTYKSKPLPNASIHFESGGAIYSDKTKDDGTYTIKVPPGEAKVQINAINEEEARKFGDLLRPRDSKRTAQPPVPNPAAPRPGAGNMPKV